MNQERIRLSKLMALMLRHQPEKFGLKLDEQGWCSLKSLDSALSDASGLIIGQTVIKQIVEEDEKGRYSIKEEHDQFLIRANQGHSTEKVKINFKAVPPPEYLYHGTNEKALEAILKEGLKRMKRHHVHLTDNYMTAVKTGSRRGRPYILIIDAKSMQSHGKKFYRSENGVWLTNSVPAKYFESVWKRH